MEPSIERTTLADIPVGGRLLVRSRKDWRVAVIARKTDEFVSISIASPSGYNYRIRRTADETICFEGEIPYLPRAESEPWRDNFTGYDVRW